MHIRTMDWELSTLKPLTINLEFQTQGRTVFRSASWAGFVGVLTGMRPGAFSVSINYKRTIGASPISILRNFYEGAFGAWPIAFLVREILTTCKDFSSALGSFSCSSLMSPVYITLCGVRPSEGAVLTRKREGEERATWLLHSHGVIVQPNLDYWRGRGEAEEYEDICDSVERRTQGEKRIARINGSTTLLKLWEAVLKPPILAQDTVHIVSMIPARDHFLTVVP